MPKKVERNLIVGLDIGTSKVVAIVGELAADGRLEVVGVGTHPSRGLKKGVVVNIDSTVQSIQRAVEEAELMAGCQIHSVLAGIAGSHVRSLNSHGIVAIRNKEVTSEDVDRVIDRGCVGITLPSGALATPNALARLLPLLEWIEVRGVPTSTSTRELAESLRIPLAGFDEFDRLELIVDGPDEVDRDGHMIKGGGACLLWERIVADAADHYVVVADTSKLKDRLGAFPLPIEVVQHGWQSTTRSIGRLLALHGYPADVPLVRRVDAAGAPVITDSGNFLVDAHLGSIADPLVIDRELNWIPGVVENGLFTGLADEVLFADPQGTITVMRCGSAPAGRPTTTPRGRGA